jgi:anti-anti-sigma regulatory factor
MSLVCPAGPVRKMGANRPWTIILDAASLEHAGIGAIGVLARLQLAAKRAGGEILLRRPDGELEELIAFVGLSGVLRAESGGQSEEGEEPLGVEEEGELGDPTG